MASSSQPSYLHRLFLALGRWALLLLPLLLFPLPTDVSLADTASNVSGDIGGNTTWTLAGSPYILEGDVTVLAGVTLTIAPGVTVKGDYSSGFSVQGRLNAVGTADAPILFTSTDDTGPGQWRGIIFDGGRGTLQYTTVRYGGTYGEGNLTLLNTSAVDLQYTHLLSGSSAGIQVGGSSHLTVTQSTVTNNYNGLVADNQGSIAVSSTVFQNNNDYPIRTSVGSLPIFLDTSNSFAGNTPNRIYVEGDTLSHNLTLVGAPSLDGYELGGDLTVAAGATLTIQPGVTVKGGYSSGLSVQGHLNALGTADAPILFTSTDDTGPGQWRGIIFDGGRGTLQYTTVRYGGTYGEGNLTLLNTSAVDLQYTHLLSGSSAGIQVGGSSHLTVTQSTVANNYNGLVADNQGSIAVSSTVFQNNNEYPIRTSVGSLPILLDTSNSFAGNTPNRIYMEGDTLSHNLALVGAPGLDGYELGGDLTVAAGATLTIQPGVTVKGDYSSGFSVQGRLNAVGTADAPILFTSTDDTGPGQWRGIIFDGGRGTLQYTTVRYGGTYGEGNLTLLNASTVDLQYTQIFSGSSAGIQVGGSSHLTVTQSTVANNYNGLVADNQGSITVSSTTFQNNSDYPIRTSVGSLPIFLDSSNSFAGNTPNRIYMEGDTLSHNLALVGAPGLDGYELGGDLTVAAGATLTIQPGVTVKGGYSSGLSVQGRLNAVGTADAPILFTSTDDTDPGQWNGILFDGGQGILQHTTVRYGGSGVSVPGGSYYNANVALHNAGPVELQYTYVLSSSSAGIQVGGSSHLTVTHGSVTHNGSYGVDVTCTTGASVHLSNVQIQDNAQEGIQNSCAQPVAAQLNWWGDASGPGGEGPGSGEAVTGPVLYEPWLITPEQAVAGLLDGGDMVRWSTLTVTPTLAVTVRVRVGNRPQPDANWTDWKLFTSLPVSLSALPPARYLQWYISGPQLPTPDQVTVTSTAQPYTLVNQQVLAGDTTWTQAKSPYLVVRNVLVGQGSTLTVEPGVTVWFSDTRSIQVDGGLVALGTAAKPITFTSWHPRGRKDDWGVIAFNSTATGARFSNGVYQSGSGLRYVNIEYGGVAYTHVTLGRFRYMLDAPRTPLYVDHATIRFNGAGGVRTLKGVITSSQILSNTLSEPNEPILGVGISDSGGGQIESNHVVDNESSGGSEVRGVGIYAVDGRIQNNTVTGNRAQNVNMAYGVGIYGEGIVQIRDNQVNGNWTNRVGTAYGGGICSLGGGDVVNNSLTDNYLSVSDTAQGGGLYAIDGARVQQNQVRGNRAVADNQAQGGGVYSQATLEGNQVVDNRTHATYTADGGGIFSSGIFSLTNNSVISNVVSYQEPGGHAWGGGIYNTGGTLDRNQIRANSAVGPVSGPVDVVDAQRLIRAVGILNVKAREESKADGKKVDPTKAYQELDSLASLLSPAVRALLSSSEPAEREQARQVLATGDGLGGGIYSTDEATIRSSLITHNSAQGDAGAIYWNVSIAGSIVYNTLESNSSGGLVGGTLIKQGYPLINHNTIQANAGQALYNGNPAADTQLDIRYNWWGTTDSTLLLEQVYDWFDDTNLGFLSMDPVLVDVPNLAPAGINLSGRASSIPNIEYEYSASAFPLAAITPITFTWEVADYPPIVHVRDSLLDTTRLQWSNPGVKQIRITASNRAGSVVYTQTVEVVSQVAADVYENDSQCAQAVTIQLDGTPQLHTFHTDTDEDWILFQAQSNVTYMVEATTPDESAADVGLEIFAQCSGSPQDGQNNSFSPDVNLAFTAPADGPIYLHLRNGTEIGQAASTAYYLSVRALSQVATPGVVVIVAGKLKENDPLQANIHQVTNSVYRMFRRNGYSGERIFYLASDTGMDADGDGVPDVDKLVTRNNLRQAITEWAAGQLKDGQPFTLYMMDHGGYDVLYLNRLTTGLETVTSSLLSDWLDELERSVPRIKINVIVEACQSGSFIDVTQSVSKVGRVVIGSTGAYPVAYSSLSGGALFSDSFLGALDRGMSLNSSFSEARWSVQQDHLDQTPWLDDNGNGIPNETEDGQVAAQRGFAYAGTFASLLWPPNIAAASFNQAQGQIQARVQTQDNRTVARVWAFIYPPSYRPSTSEELVVENVPEVELQASGGNGLFAAEYTFTESGPYRVVIYAKDEADLVSQAVNASNLEQISTSTHIYLPAILK